MSAPVFLVPAGSLELTEGSSVTLDGPEGRHAASVRRIRPGERIVLCDGRGVSARTTVAAVGKDRLDCVVDEVVRSPAPSPHLTVAQGLPKGDRAALAVELMTEAGVDTIVPWLAARSVPRWEGDKAGKGIERWSLVAAEAAKQSRRTWVPVIEELSSTAGIAERAKTSDLVVILHEEATQDIADIDLEGTHNVLLVVGPEGGIDHAEIEVLQMESQLAPVRLGPEVVRTSTAAALAAAVLLSRTPRWRSGGSQASPA